MGCIQWVGRQLAYWADRVTLHHQGAAVLTPTLICLSPSELTFFCSPVKLASLLKPQLHLLGSAPDHAGLQRLPALPASPHLQAARLRARNATFSHSRAHATSEPLAEAGEPLYSIKVCPGRWRRGPVGAAHVLRLCLRMMWAGQCWSLSCACPAVTLPMLTLPNLSDARRNPHHQGQAEDVRALARAPSGCFLAVCRVKPGMAAVT